MSSSFTVVGCGSAGSRHIRNLITLGIQPGNIRAVDRESRRTLNIHDGVEMVYCAGEIRTGNIGNPDALLICTPADQHDELIAFAQHRCIPFFVEKPAALSTDVSFHWDTDVPHLVACNLRFRDEAIDLKALAAHQIAGAFTCRQDMAQWPGRGYASPLFEFCHEIHLALWMFGPAMCLGVSLVDGARVLRLAHVSGATSRVTIGHADGQHVRLWQVGDIIRSFAGPLPRVNEMYLREMQHFLRVLDGTELSCNTLADARQVVAICEEAERLAMVAA